jgi:3',5'-cyclic AMP phosphodiesterase CpdA
MVRVIQISDTHLSPTKRHFDANWAPVVRFLAEHKPDLVIHTGDVTVDAAGEEADAAYCAGLLTSLGVPVVTVPGNHDVGEVGNPYQPVNEERLARFRRHFGDDRWLRDIEGWRLIGLNSMIFGGGREDAGQTEWLEAAMADAGGRRIAWFTHRPLFIDAPTEGDTGYWSVKPEPRRALLDLLHRYRVEIVASGHLHRWHEIALNGTRYIWGPSTGFLVGPQMAPPMGGAARLGAVIYDIAGENIDVNIRPVAGLTDYWIDDVVHEVYPPRDAKA